MVVVTLIGILTTVAVPILAKQLLRAKTVEAYEALSKIRDGAKAYYVHTHWDKNGNVLPYGFPTNVTMVPHDGPKCDRVDTPHKVWDKAGWHSLSFAFVDYHYFAYTFVSNGATGTAAAYSARAHGDLDCDGKWSTFELRGSINSEGDVATLGPIVTKEME